MRALIWKLVSLVKRRKKKKSEESIMGVRCRALAICEIVKMTPSSNPFFLMIMVLQSMQMTKTADVYAGLRITLK